MSTANVPAAYQTNNIYASNGHRTSVSRRRHADTSFLCIGSQFDNIHPVAYNQTSPQDLHSCPSVSAVDTRSLSAGVHTRSNTDPRETRASGLTATGRSDYVHTTRLIESDLHSISTPFPGRIYHIQQTAVRPPLYRNVRDTWPWDFRVGQRLPAYTSETPDVDPHHGSLASEYSQMGRWLGETAEQQPWDGLVAASAIPGPERHVTRPRTSNSQCSSRRNGGSSDF